MEIVVAQKVIYIVVISNVNDPKGTQIEEIHGERRVNDIRKDLKVSTLGVCSPCKGLCTVVIEYK